LENNYMQLPVLRLNPKADYKLRNGHLWIYSNEIDNKFKAIKTVQPGDEAIIENSLGKTLGIAYINPNTLICGRILSTDSSRVFDRELLITRIKNALALRQQVFAKDCYRLVYGESDLLPGLVIDRFFDLFVVQISTAGMERHINIIIESLDYIFKAKAILLKNDGKMREVEGLENYVSWKKGPESETAYLEENGVKFNAPILQGQKTGWFYDHRMTRARLADYVQGKKVLDVFAYIGGWGIQAGAFGAKQVVLNDISDFALNYVTENAKLNNLTNISTIKGDAFEVMDNLNDSRETFDVVILDPPAFIPKRKDLAKGVAAYQKANLQAMRLLNPEGGILVSGSCSMHLTAEELRAGIHKAGLKLGRQVQILEQGHQGPDHPIHPAIPETEYLKSFIARVY
jgi:23S rRNA (cytosine1962-C5)-methyltransferase